MSYPKAIIYETSGDKLINKSFDEIDAVNLLKDFLNNKELYLRHLF